MGGGRKPLQAGRTGSWAAPKRLLSKPTWGQQLPPVTQCSLSFKIGEELVYKVVLVSGV